MNRTTVVTMSPKAFATACTRLQQLCSADFKPDLVIGIVRGGEYVANLMFMRVPHLMITRQRSGTSLKSRGIIHWILKNLPYPCLDFMRKVEAWQRERSHYAQQAPVELTQQQIEAISQASKILIVDDSIDTGAIMQAVRDSVAAHVAPGVEIKTAAITVTTSAPCISPDFALYRNHTLIRFPWSNDYKN